MLHLCVMSVRVGVRELRQNLSVYLRRVEAGESFEVTERGRAVASLTPLPSDDPLARLVSAGRALPAEGDLLDLGPPLRLHLEQPLSTILEELREER